MSPYTDLKVSRGSGLSGPIRFPLPRDILAMGAAQRSKNNVDLLPQPLNSYGRYLRFDDNAPGRRGLRRRSRSFGGVFVVCLFEIRLRESPNFGSGLTWSSAPNGALGFVDISRFTNPPDTFIHNTRLGWIPTNCKEIFPGG